MTCRRNLLIRMSVNKKNYGTIKEITAPLTLLNLQMEQVLVLKNTIKLLFK